MILKIVAAMLGKVLGMVAIGAGVKLQTRLGHVHDLPPFY
jgi:hypothetical protein